jgi:hypothetical protein
MKARLFIFGAALALASPVHALCSGASLEQEFREADLVVRARLVSEVKAWDDSPSTAFKKQWGDGGPVILYGLATIEVFKGRPGRRLDFFEEQNSGAFYLDVDRDYLLFVNYVRPYPGRPEAARGAVHVRYACGQSRPWSKVGAGQLAALRLWSAPR